MKPLVLLSAVLLSAFGLHAQQKYFIDGFHGGVYGHYPLETYTRYIVEQMERHPAWYIGLEIEPETWDSVKVVTPEAYRDFRRLAQGDRVECTNPSYAQPYLYCISGESIIRQFQYGIAKTRHHFPDMTIATYAVEEPCFSSCMPTILPQLGFRYAVLKCPNTCWGGYSASYGGELVNLTGPDGTPMLAVPRYGCEGLERESVWQTDAWANKESYFEACFAAGIRNPAGMTYQDAGWTNGPWIGYGGQAQRGTKYTRWTKYIEEQSIGTSDDNHRFSQEEVLPGLMWGSQVLQRLARQCRHSERLVPQAEKVTAMASLETGFRCPQSALDEAWRTLMLSQHHDCWIVPYNRLNHRGTWADNVALWTASADIIARTVIDQALRSYGCRGGEAIRIVNTAAHPRREVVGIELADGHHADIEADVPAFGYAVIPLDVLDTATPTRSIRIDSRRCVMANDLYSITFDLERGGVVTSIEELSGGYNYADRSAEFGFGELRGYFADERRFISSTESRASARIVADNTLVRSVEIEGTIAGTTFRKCITLRKGSPVIDCNLTIEWQDSPRIGDFTRLAKRDKYDKRTTFYDTRYHLSLLFPVAMRQAKLYKSAPLDVCESRLESTFFNSWDSLKHNVILEWLDLHSAKDSRSLALFTDHTTSYSYATDHPLALTVQYSGGGLWGRNYTLDGASTLHYAIVPHTSTWDGDSIQQLSTAWNEPLIVAGCHADSPRSQSLIDVGNSGYEITSVTREGDDLLVRLFNASGDDSENTVTLHAGVVGAAVTDLLGNKVAKLEVVRKSSDTVQFTISMPRFAVRTCRLKLSRRTGQRQ